MCRPLALCAFVRGSEEREDHIQPARLERIEAGVPEGKATRAQLTAIALALDQFIDPEFPSRRLCDQFSKIDHCLLNPEIFHQHQLTPVKFVKAEGRRADGSLILG